MPAETSLDRLLAGMRPALQAGEYRYCTLPPGAALPPGLAPLGTFREAEGLTLIVEAAAAAAAGLPGIYPCRLITLQVHSSLDAIGFIARISARLAEHGLPANVVAGYFHDHLLVPADRAEEALALLEAMRGRGQLTMSNEQ